MFDMNSYLKKCLEEIESPRIYHMLEQNRNPITDVCTNEKRDAFSRKNEQIQIIIHCLSNLLKALPDFPVDMHKKMHNHEFFELVYIYRGSFTQSLKHLTFKQDHSCMVLLNPFAYHNIAEDTLDSIAVNILIDPEFFTEFLQNQRESDITVYNFLFDSIYGISRQDHLVFPTSDALENLVLDIVAEYYDRKPFYTSIVQVKMENLLLLLAREYRPYDFTSKKSDSDKAERIRAYIQQNYVAATLPSMAADFGYSPHYLSDLIRRVTGKSFSALLAEQRLLAACSMLVNSSIPSQKISLLVGYKTESSLFRIMQKRYGLTPGQYRAKYRTKRDGSCPS